MFVCVSMALKYKRPLLLGHSTPSGVTPWTTVSLQCLHVASWLLGVTWVQGQCAYWTSANLPVTLVQQMRPCIGGLAQLVILCISVSEQGRDRSTLYYPWCIAPSTIRRWMGRVSVWCSLVSKSNPSVRLLGKPDIMILLLCVPPPPSSHSQPSLWPHLLAFHYLHCSVSHPVFALMLRCSSLRSHHTVVCEITHYYTIVSFPDHTRVKRHSGFHRQIPWALLN